MEQVVGDIPQGFLQELLVEDRNFGVLVRLPDRLPRVLFIEGFRPLLPYLPCRGDWLPAASQASARTGHHFNERVR